MDVANASLYDGASSLAESALMAAAYTIFDTIESLKEHEKSEQEDKELQNKGV